MSLIDFLVDVELDSPRPDYRALLIAVRGAQAPTTDAAAEPSAFQPHVAAWRTAWQNFGLDPALFELGAQPSDAPLVTLGTAVARRFELPVTVFALDGFEGPCASTSPRRPSATQPGPPHVASAPSTA